MINKVLNFIAEHRLKIRIKRPDVQKCLKTSRSVCALIDESRNWWRVIRNLAARRRAEQKTLRGFNLPCYFWACGSCGRSHDVTNVLVMATLTMLQSSKDTSCASSDDKDDAVNATNGLHFAAAEDASAENRRQRPMNSVRTDNATQ
jgi:hypothetical protein